MYRGGHTERFSYMVTVRAVYKHLDTLDMDRRGVITIYRSRAEMLEDWEQQGGKPDS